MLEKMDATSIAEAIRSKEFTPKETLAFFQKQTEEKNPVFNAFVQRFTDEEIDRYLKDANPKSPLYGVPFAIKDIGIQLKGHPTTCSCSYLKNYTASYDCALMKRYLEAGLIPIGKTMTPEFGLMGITEPKLYGACRNPWDPTRSAGGSSGGSAAAVAAGMIPIAHGTDGGGSIRIPASACGLIGLKPSRGLMASGPYVYNTWYGLVAPHVLAKSVRDSALLLEIGQGNALGEPIYGSYQEKGTFLKNADPVKKKFKVAFTKDSLLAQENSSEALKALDKSLKICRELGHEVKEIDLNINKEEMRMAYLIVVATSLAYEIKQLPKIYGRPYSRKDFEPTTWILFRFGAKLRATQVSQAIASIQIAGYEMDKALSDVDFLMTPTTTDVPPEVGLMELSVPETIGTGALEIVRSHKLMTEVIKLISKRAFENTGNTQIANMLGLPAISMPFYKSDSDLPIGTQIQGKLGADADLIQLAAQMEAYAPTLCQ